MERKKKVLVGCSGSVATIKVGSIASLLIKSGFDVQVVVTKCARHFFKPQDIPNSVRVWKDEDEWESWRDRGDPVVHIELAKWADLLLISPLDANTLAKISTGICDNLLTCVVRAWDLQKPLVYCPAMNTAMYSHPITKEQLNKLSQFGYFEVPVVSKTLICGDTGLGAMAEVSTIIDAVANHLK